ncbi:MAG: LysE family transporter [Rhodospirillales bacterium]|nr:LysE family transporter [Rhodospirillales bacterium]
MALDTLAAFALATVILILIPGPSIMLTVAHATTHGAWRTLNTVNGAIAACAVHLAIAGAGVGWLMVLAADWFEVLRWGGVAYLVFMGVQSWRAGSRPQTEETRPVRSGHSLFAEGFLVTLSNPKGIIFVAAFFPQFLDAALAPVPQFVILGAVYLVIAYVLTAAYGFLADHIMGLFRGEHAARLRCRITGAVLVGGGLMLAAVRR